MLEPQELYDSAMFDFSQGNYDATIEVLSQLLTNNPSYFDAQLALGMAYFRKGDYPRAIAEGHKAEQLKPKEQLTHTNLSLFYMKAGNKEAAEHHGMQARIASWKTDLASGSPVQPADPDLQLGGGPKTGGTPVKFPEMPWKKKG
jgi:tetratricopeptide (TPR) repeat protein